MITHSITSFWSRALGVAVLPAVLHLAPVNAADMVAWWPGEDAVGDIIGNSHVAVASGTQAYVAGKVGRAFSFNGIDQSANTTVSTDVLNQVPLTIEGWVKPESHATGSISDPLPTNVISNDRVNFGGHGFGVHIYPDGSKLNIGVQGVEADFRTIPGVTIVPDEWVHIAVVYSPGQAKTYVNGQLRDTFTYTQAAMEGNQVVRIGRHNDDAGFGTRRFFKGAIDELSLYSTAFSAAQVNAIHLAGSSGKARDEAGRQFALAAPQLVTNLWQYGQVPSSVIDTASFALHQVRSNDGPEIEGWSTTNGSIIGVNPTESPTSRGSPQRLYAPHQVFMHPSASGGGQPAVVRWKAPQAGLYAASATFTDIDAEGGLSKSVSMYHNDIQKFVKSVSGFLGNGESATRQIIAAAGDTVDFIVSEGTDGPDYDSTGLVASVVLLTPSAPRIVVEEPVGNVLIDNIGGITFGDQGNGYASATKVFTIRNAGTLPLEISSAGVDGGAASEFAVNTTSMVTTVAPGGSTTFSVVFTPSALGLRSTTLSIVSNDTTFDNPMSGTGVAPAFGAIGFALSTGEVLESGGTANITLARTGGSNGPVTVRVNSAPGSATSPADYTAVTNTLVSFANGQTTATVPVSILADALVDPGETFTLTVSDPQGAATLDTAVATTTLTIVNTLDTTAPTLDVIQAWIEKVGTKYAFKLLLDARDNHGINTVQFRLKLNSVLPLPVATPWVDWEWLRGQPLVTTQACTSIIIEMRALDAAGNASPIRTRTFGSPFPVTTVPPNFYPRVDAELPYAGTPIDCRGLFVNDFNGDGLDDVLQIDRLTGAVKIRRQNTNGTYSSSGLTLATNAINDSAIGDFDGDERPDIAIVISDSLAVYHNDGPDGTGAPQFSLMNTAGLAATGISTVTNVAVGDVTGEGKPDIIITGTGDDGAMGTVAKIAVLINNAQFQLAASNHAFAYPTSSAGPVELGDVTGDGIADAVMIDATNKQVLLFINKANGSFGDANDADAAMRPQATVTGALVFGGVTPIPMTPQSLTVGDVTGDGRADVVVIMHYRSHLVGDGPGFDRDYQLWQLLDSRFGAVTLHANGGQWAGQAVVPVGSAPFKSDVILEDLNDDGFPEFVMTNQFVDDENGVLGGIVVGFIEPHLDSTNTMTTFYYSEIRHGTGITNPQRLAAGSFAGASPLDRDIVLASGDAKPLEWIFFHYVSSSKTNDLLTGASTDSDTKGTPGLNGTYSYEVDVGGVINYSLTYVNNSTTAIVAGVVECKLPPQLSFLSGDAGYALVPSGTSKYLRWTQDIPAGASSVKRFSVRVDAGQDGGVVLLTGTLKRGTTVLATKALPKVVLIEPLDLRMTVLSTSDSAGQRAHIEEIITYRMRVKNYGTGTISGFKLGMSLPANTTLAGGTSPPTPLLGGVFPNYTSVTWMNLTLLPDAEMTLEVRVQVKPTVANGIIIKNTTAAFTRADGTKVTAPAASTTIQPPLELTLTSNKSIVQPGEIIRYTFTAHNWLRSAITNAKVVDELPVGVALLSAAVNDNVDSPTGAGNFDYVTGTWTAAQLTPNTLPAYDRNYNIMTWVLGRVPAESSRKIEFDVIVKQDIPTFANIGGVSTTLEVQNKSFNFVGTTSTNTRIFAGAPRLGTALASPANAGSYYLLSSVFPVRRSLLSDPPLTPPKLSFIKSAEADGLIVVAGERVCTVINDSAVTMDGLVDYKLEYRNQTGAGLGRGVVIRDFLPTGMTFMGFVARTGVPVPSFVGYRFYTASLTEMFVLGAEGFTDTNSNGFYDVGEVYADTNKNKKYDGVTASLVRSIDFPAGDLSGGATGNFVYQAKTVSSPGLVLTSYAGGITGVKNGLDYTKVAGFQMFADNLHFPVNGGPAKVKVLVTAPAHITHPVGSIKSRTTLADTQSAGIAFPYEISGAVGVAVSNMKLDVLIPKGYLVQLAQVFNTAGTAVQKYAPGATDNTFTIGAANSVGVRNLSVPLGNLKIGFPLIKLALDPLTKAVLKNASGQTKAPLTLTPKFAGSYTKSAAATAARMVKFGAAADAAAAPVPLPLAADTTFATLPVQADTTKDAKIFVGRCAPVSVKRGDTFSYTIFVGNLTTLTLGTGTIEMSVPAGCDFVSASTYAWNQDTTGEAGGSGFKAVRSGAKVIWNISGLNSCEGGAVTLTVKVREDFTGTRIDDNSCTFDVVNASGKTPGPIGVIVRAGNETTQSSDIAQNALQGFDLQFTDPVRAAMTQNLALSSASSHITCGGADQLQLNNGVAVIQMKKGRVMVVGPPDKVLASGLRLVKSDATMRVAVGPGDTGCVELTRLPTLSVSTVQSARTVLMNLHNPGQSLVAAGGGNLVAAGGGNLVAAGAGNLIGLDGATLIGLDGATLVGLDGGTFTNISSLVAAGGGNLIGASGSTLIAAGAANLVAAGGGNLVAAGAGNLVGNDGAGLVGNDGAGLVAAGAGNLIGQDGGSLVAAGGGNIFSTHTGNLIQSNGLSLVPNKF